jgi:hypothetical protein
MPAFAVDGIVINRTSGQPQPGAIVMLVQPGQGGLQTLGTAKTDAAGKFSFDKNVQGPQLVQAIFSGVLYTKPIMPGAPSTNIQVDVYDATKNPATAQVAQHMILLQPSEKDLSVGESILYQNAGKLAFNDPANGSARFWAPSGAKSPIQVTVNAPGGMPIQRAAEKTADPNIYKIDYPIKPGETRFDITYSLPLSKPAVFEAKKVIEGKLRLVAPSGVTLKGDKLTDLGREPQTQAAIYEIQGDAYKVEIEGTGTLERPGASTEDESGAPTIQQALPHVYSKTFLGAPARTWILVITFSILGLGTFLLSRGAAVRNAKR